jgi:hypothetical protein
MSLRMRTLKAGVVIAVVCMWGLAAEVTAADAAGNTRGQCSFTPFYVRSVGKHQAPIVWMGGAEADHSARTACECLCVAACMHACSYPRT